MEDFESQLRSVQLAVPGTELRSRIFAQEPVRLRFSDLVSRRIPVGWAAVLAICAGLIGMYVSDYVGMRSMAPRVVNVENLTITNTSEANPFDFTSDDGMGDFMPGVMKVTVGEHESERI